jgi:uncharacterized membrane protein
LFHFLSICDFVANIRKFSLLTPKEQVFAQEGGVMANDMDTSRLLRPALLCLIVYYLLDNVKQNQDSVLYLVLIPDGIKVFIQAMQCL